MAETFRYFSLAHEIAHNLVHPHNSEHEFYFSTICEQHMVALAALLNSPQPGSLPGPYSDDIHTRTQVGSAS